MTVSAFIFFYIFSWLYSFAVPSICIGLYCISAQFFLSSNKISKALVRFVQSDGNWWKGTCKGRTGLIPSNYGESAALTALFFSASELFLSKPLNTLSFSALVAEKSESIDNPIHEAAKRGATPTGTRRSLCVLVWLLLLTCDRSNRQHELAEGVLGQQGRNQRAGQSWKHCPLLGVPRRTHR